MSASEARPNENTNRHEAAAPPPPAVQARGVSVSYRGVPAVREVDLDIPAGEVTALIGPSGCGKTSFLNTLNRMSDLVDGCEVQGRIQVGDVDIHGPGVDVVALRRSVGMIFQRPNPFPLSIRKNLHLPLREHGIRRGELDDLTQSALMEVGLWDEVCDRLEDAALALSGGQQQRLCIARALALRPRVLLMDEPCSSLDPLATETIETLIRRMQGEYTIVIITHHLAQARRLADTAAVFWVRDSCGRLIESGPASQILENPQDPDAVAYVRGRRG